MKSLYLLIHIFTMAFPLIRSFEPLIRYATKWRALWPGMVATATFFIVWDVLFTRAGVWGFNPRYLLGLSFWGLPFEELLFFFTVPFASVFIYECVIYFLPKAIAGHWLEYVTVALGGAIIVIGVWHHDQAYTFWNFLFGGSALVITGLVAPRWLSWFWIAYWLHLIPFFVVNGVLTGSFIEEEVVWYNNAENLAIRLGTIPVEDTVYALLLLLMNVAFFERFKKQIR